MNRLFHSIVLTCMVPAGAFAQGAVTDAQRQSFHAFYQKHAPDDHSDQPLYERHGALLLALVDTPPRRGLRSLCRMERRVFEHRRGWSAQALREQYVWLDANACNKPARPIRLASPMPDADVAGLLERQAALLKSARLLFGGNSDCAAYRALPYQLRTIEIGTLGSGPEVMAILKYGDRQVVASVAVRRSGLDYSAWNVGCRIGEASSTSTAVK